MSATRPLEPREEFQLLVERLAEHLTAGGTPVPSGVVFALENDGSLYALVRRPLKGGAALSVRERETAALVARGLSNKLIATELGVSSHTVATYIRRVFVKLGVTSRAAMVAAVEGR